MSLLLALAVSAALAGQEAAAVAAPPGAKVWIGHAAEYEGFLRSAPIQKLEDIPVGVTHPRRALFEPGGLARRAAVKKLKPGLQQGFWESYKSEIAAYELDRLLEMNMVPVTVERRVESDLVAVQLWVEGCRLLKETKGESAPDSEAWNRQVFRQRVFDNLIANIDRNAGNLLIDDQWNLILIDHSRAFTGVQTLPFEKQMTKIDRPFYERLVALDEAALQASIGKWVNGADWIRAMLKRRDKIVSRFDTLAKERGEGAVFTR